MAHMRAEMILHVPIADSAQDGEGCECLGFKA